MWHIFSLFFHSLQSFAFGIQQSARFELSFFFCTIATTSHWWLRNSNLTLNNNEEQDKINSRTKMWSEAKGDCKIVHVTKNNKQGRVICLKKSKPICQWKTDFEVWTLHTLPHHSRSCQIHSIETKPKFVEKWIICASRERERMATSSMASMPEQARCIRRKSMMEATKDYTFFFCLLQGT